MGRSDRVKPCRSPRRIPSNPPLPGRGDHLPRQLPRASSLSLQHIACETVVGPYSRGDNVARSPESSSCVTVQVMERKNRGWAWAAVSFGPILSPMRRDPGLTPWDSRTNSAGGAQPLARPPTAGPPAAPPRHCLRAADRRAPATSHHSR